MTDIGGIDDFKPGVLFEVVPDEYDECLLKLSSWTFVTTPVEPIKALSIISTNRTNDPTGKCGFISVSVLTI